MDNKNLRIKIIGDRLKQFRIDNNISQKDLAASIETSVQTITQIETYKREASLDLIEKYAIFFNLSIEDIVKDIVTVNKSKDIITVLEIAQAAILEAFPVRIPVYSHRELLDPKIADIKPIDNIYWTKEKIKNRNLFAVHVQTGNLYPDINVNDRLIIDPDLPISSGIGICFDGRARSNFANSQGAHIVKYEAAENNKYVFSNNFDEVKRKVKEGFYKGMAIQKVTPLSIRGINVIYPNLETGVDLNSMRSK